MRTSGSTNLSSKVQIASPPQRSKSNQTVPENHTVYVQGFPVETDSLALRKFFEQFGPVGKGTRVIPNRGFGFVEFESAETMHKALAAASSQTSLVMNGGRLRVERARGETAESISAFEGSWTTSSTCDEGIGFASPQKAQKAKIYEECTKEDESASTRGMLEPSIREDRNKFHCVVLKYLPFGVTSDEITRILEAFGPISSCRVKTQTMSDADGQKLDNSSGLLKVVRTTFYEPSNAAAVFQACGREDIHANLVNDRTVDIGPYHKSPDLVDVLEFVSQFGEVYSCATRPCYLVAEVRVPDAGTVEALLSSPVFCRGIRLEVDNPTLFE